MSVPLRVECYRFEDAEPFKISKPSTKTVRRRVIRPFSRLVTISAISIVFSVLGLAAVGAMTLMRGFAAGGDLKPIGQSSFGPLSSVVGSVHRSEGFVTVTGSVSNPGGAAASDVQAIVELVNGKNQTVQIERAMIAFGGVSAGQSSPFSVTVTDEPTAVGYRLNFRHADGRSIE